MSTNAKLVLIWIITTILLAVCAMYINKQNEARKVESFPNHSEIPNNQNFEEHVESRLNSAED